MSRRAGRGRSDGSEEGRRSGLGYCAAVGACRLGSPGARTGGPGDWLEAGDTAQRGHRAGAGSGAAQATVIRMAETSAGGLDVGLGPVELRGTVVVHHGIQAGQAGAGRQEDCQQEERLDPAKVRSPGETERCMCWSILRRARARWPAVPGPRPEAGTRRPLPSRRPSPLRWSPHASPRTSCRGPAPVRCPGPAGWRSCPPD